MREYARNQAHGTCVVKGLSVRATPSCARTPSRGAYSRSRAKKLAEVVWVPTPVVMVTAMMPPTLTTKDG